MSVRTKSMTHLESAADGFIAVEGQARGLANTFFEGLRELAIEVGTDDYKKLLAEFDKVLLTVEEDRRVKLVALTGDEDMTLTKYASSYKVRKSQLRKGIQSKVDPRKSASYTDYMKAIDAVTGGNSHGRSSSSSGKADDKTGSTGNAAPPSKEAAKLQTVTSGLSAKVQDRLGLLAKHLAGLSEDDQLKALQRAEGYVHQLIKAGGRYANAKTG